MLTDISDRSRSAFGDFDHDGDLDLFHVNGWSESPGKFNDQPARLFENRGNGTFREAAESAGAADRGQGRGLLLLDLENDGDLDIFICNNHELVINGEDRLRQPAEPVLLRNDTPRVNHWLKVNLAGAPPWHRDGIGSRVYVRTGTTRRGWDTSKWLALSPAPGTSRATGDGCKCAN